MIHNCILKDEKEYFDGFPDCKGTVPVVSAGNSSLCVAATVLAQTSVIFCLFCEFPPNI